MPGTNPMHFTFVGHGHCRRLVVGGQTCRSRSISKQVIRARRRRGARPVELGAGTGCLGAITSYCRSGLEAIMEVECDALATYTMQGTAASAACGQSPPRRHVTATRRVESARSCIHARACRLAVCARRPGVCRRWRDANRSAPRHGWWRRRPERVRRQGCGSSENRNGFSGL